MERMGTVWMEETSREVGDGDGLYEGERWRRLERRAMDIEGIIMGGLCRKQGCGRKRRVWRGEREGEREREREREREIGANLERCTMEERIIEKGKGREKG
jgi:hypothetical protein